MRIDEMIAARRLAAQVRPFQEYPKYITVDGKQVLVQSEEEELAAIMKAEGRDAADEPAYDPSFAILNARIVDGSAPKAIDKRPREYKNSLKD